MQFYAETLRRKGEARLQGYGNGVGSLAPRLSDTLVARLYRCSEFELRIYAQVVVLSVATRLFFFHARLSLIIMITAHRFHRETLSFFSFLCLLPFFATCTKYEFKLDKLIINYF